eukprot:scaffold108123_cov18-Tisochrysis_lutea.AAC.1
MADHDEWHLIGQDDTSSSECVPVRSGSGEGFRLQDWRALPACVAPSVKLQRLRAASRQTPTCCMHACRGALSRPTSPTLPPSSSCTAANEQEQQAAAAVPAAVSTCCSSTEVTSPA